MNPKDVLHRVAESEDPRQAKVLWHIQGLALSGELKSFCERFEKAHAERIRDRSWLWRSCSRFASVEEAVRAFCERGENLRGEFLVALTEFIALDGKAVSQQFYVTNVGRQVWDTLDWALEERRPCYIEGREGRGKTASARAWFEAHRGQARYVSLPGLGVQRDFFNALANAYGVPFLAAKAPNEIRWRVCDAIVRSGLVLIIDEAHHALPERHRAGRPPLIDFIDCDLCNAGVPVALISTPQFGPRLAEFEDRTKWNAGQFRRRFSGRWSALPQKTTEADLVALAKTALPQVGTKGVKLAVGYAGAFDRDVSGLFDLVRDAQRRARKAKRAHVTYQDLRDAYELDRVPLENALAEAFKRPVYAPPGYPPAEDLPEHCDTAATELQPDRCPAFAESPPRRGITPAVPVTA